MSFIFRPISFLSLALLSASVARADVSLQCMELFKSAPQTAMAPSLGGRSTVMKETGFIDSSGRPLLREVPVEPEAGSLLASMPVASYIDVFSPEQVTKRLSNKKISDELKDTYEQMLARGPQRFVVRPNSVKILDPLYELMPNFKPVLDHIKRSIALSIAAGEPLHFTPIILLGEPGVGKTHFAEELAEALQTGYEIISMNSMTAGWILSGSSSGWKDARQGKVSTAVIEGELANPVMVVDEIDKASGSSQYDPMGSLYQLWEARTARKYVDEFLEVPIDASHINWIATANDISKVPEPIQTRAMIFRINAPSESQMQAVVKSLMAAALAKYPRLPFSPTVSTEVFQAIKTQTPRDIRKLLEVGMGNAVLDGRQVLIAKDIDLSILEAEPQKNRIGF